MASIVRSPVGFSIVEREIILKILEECADSLAVYQNTLRQPVTGDAANAFPEIGILETSILQPLVGDAAAKMTDSREAVYEKLRQDSLYVANVIRDLKREISEHGTIGVLIEEMERITSRERQEYLLLEEHERMQASAAELRKKIADKKTSNEREEECLTRELTLTRDEAERLKLIKDVEMRYVRAWEKARREQNELRYKLEMDELEKTLSDCHVRERNEKRVNRELVQYLTHRISFIENQIEGWQRRYDREKEMYEREIRKVRNEIEEDRKELEKLTAEYRGNQEFIDTYLAEQEVLRRQKEHEDHVRRSAIRMQAWWRGVMVRRKLGPYRPEEKKKKRPVKTKK